MTNQYDIDLSATWIGYMFVYDLSGGEKGNFLWPQPSWPVADLETILDISNNTIQLFPNFNTWEPTDAYWVDPDTGEGAKFMEAQTYVELPGVTDTWDNGLTFHGNVGSNTLSDDYEAYYFIKALDPDNGYADIFDGSKILPLPGSGTFSVTAEPDEFGYNHIIQYGFIIKGRNANPANRDVLGSITLNNNTTATSSGDPYVTTFSGHKYKIPNKNNIYRMFQYFKENEKVIINASVSQLTNSEKQQLLKITRELGIINPILNGYYYDKFYISYNDKYILFDRNIKIIDTNIDTQDEKLYIKYSDTIKDFSCPIQGTSKYKSTYIKLPNIEIELQNIYHLQIINGINVNYSGKDIRDVKGIFNTNKHPKNYIVKKIENKKIINYEKGKEYKRQDKENWIKVK